jgi:methylmalonyl-CoA/ethylmalonyl-CoA epimerase
MTENGIITQVCIVVKDVKKVNSNWAKVLGVPEEKIETIFPEGIIHFTNGKPVEYKDCQVAKYKLDQFILELIQPGESPSPWRTFLEKNGQGVFHFCILVNDRKVFQQTLTGIGVDFPYHIGYTPQGSYSYVNSKEQLGLELSVNNWTGNNELFDQLIAGTINPMDELR